MPETTVPASNDAPVPANAATHRYMPAALRISPRVIREEMRHADSFNAKFAILLTKAVGTMWAFYVFNGIALVSLPSAIKSGNLTVLIAWISSNWIQLVLLPALMVGQNLQAVASDARAAKTFDDVQAILDRLDAHTQGGIKDILDKLDGIGTKLEAEGGAAHPGA